MVMIQMSEKRRMLIFTGDGKGKTTAALGMILRASGHGMRTLMLQFLKSDTTTGELAALQHLPGVEVVQKGRGFVPREKNELYEEHRRTAQEALAVGREALGSGRYELVVLDEICGAVASGLVEEEIVVEAIGQASPRTCVVLTGRSATARLMELADTVTEMHCVKHGYKAGFAAQKGVEF